MPNWIFVALVLNAMWGLYVLYRAYTFWLESSHRIREVRAGVKDIVGHAERAEATAQKLEEQLAEAEAARLQLSRENAALSDEIASLKSEPRRLPETSSKDASTGWLEAFFEGSFSGFFWRWTYDSLHEPAWLRPFCDACDFDLPSFEKLELRKVLQGLDHTCAHCGHVHLFTSAPLVVVERTQQSVKHAIRNGYWPSIAQKAQERRRRIAAKASPAEHEPNLPAEASGFAGVWLSQVNSGIKKRD